MESANPISVVPKLASDGSVFRRRALHCGSGREAIATFVRATATKPGGKVLCPAYVGWSPREGSGVLDPLTSLGLRVGFYRVGSDLSVDLEDLASRLKGEQTSGVILIHFFGHIDPSYPEVVRLIRDAGAWCLEDEAHALFTDLVAGASGRLGDASVLSLHKMLPVRGGGVLLLNPASNLTLENLDAPHVSASMLWDHDLAAIAERRRRNTSAVAEMLKPLAGRVDSLWAAAANGEILQTYPVILRGANRDRVYEMMNARGYGVVSLYHTLVDGIKPAEYPHSHGLSRSILNLPIHQDLRAEQLGDLIEHLGVVLDEVGHDDRS